MKNDADINMYKGLASYILPDGVLEYFDRVSSSMFSKTD